MEILQEKINLQKLTIKSTMFDFNSIIHYNDRDEILLTISHMNIEKSNKLIFVMFLIYFGQVIRKKIKL